MLFNNGGRRRPAPPADWTPPDKTVVVIGSPRSGSTLLCALMAQTGRLGRPDEYFKRRPYERWAIDRDSPERRCRLVVAEGGTPNGVCAMKIFSYHFERVQKQIELFDWFPAPSFVWIRRRDLLGQAISASIAKQTGRYRSFYDDRGVEPRYAYADVAQRLEAAARDEAFWRLHLARTAAPFHELWYEDLMAAPTDAVRRLAEATGVGPTDRSLTIEGVGLAVQRSDVNEDWRERFHADALDPDQAAAVAPQRPERKSLKRMMRLVGLRKA